MIQSDELWWKHQGYKFYNSKYLTQLVTHIPVWSAGVLSSIDSDSFIDTGSLYVALPGGRYSATEPSDLTSSEWCAGAVGR